MTSLKRWIRDLFGFSGKETNGFIILLPLIGVILFAQPIYQRLFYSQKSDAASDRQRLDSIISQWEQEKKSSEDQSVAKKFVAIQRFQFDPNKATAAELNTLGFAENLAKRIIRYREKGGVFRIKSDLNKIYGMDSAFYKQLYTYINLPESLNDVKFTKEYNRRPTPEKTKFNLNTADTSILKMINGIGPVLARRIVKYRESLGGFIRFEQLNEVYGLDTAVVNRIFKDSFVGVDFSPKQLNINEANETELDIHPYLNKITAKAIVTYRFQHGKFKSVEEIRNIVLIKKELADKIIPYLTID